VRRTILFFFLSILACAGNGLAEPPPARLEEVRVSAKYEDLVGTADSASDGVIPGQVARQLPLLRPAEALELVPGLVITQHSGAGKANQYFLRGFNLDHGTDFLLRLAGMQVNLPTHGHGQGYADLNFLIPELVDAIRYAKGPYRAQDGDFATAGSAEIDYLRALPAPLAQFGVGQNGYARLLLAGSPALGGGTLMYGLELGANDGPWENPENYRRHNGVLRYSQGSAANGWAVTAMAYGANWDSTDQIALRAVNDGYRFSPRWSAWLDVYNLFDRDVSDIEYFYVSRLPGEPEAGIADIHFHPAEPQTFRLFVQVTL
jgi:hypothetical protein